MADTLLRDPIEVPLLVVLRRSKGPYHHVVVAADFSSASRAALETAVRWFGGARLTLFHAFEPAQTDPAGLGYGNEARAKSASLACEQMLAEMALAPEVTDRLQRVVERGTPEALLHAIDCDVMVVRGGT